MIRRESGILRVKNMSAPVALALGFMLFVGAGPAAAGSQEPVEERLAAVEAQFAASAGPENSAGKVSFSTALSVDRVHPGSRFQAALILDIQDGWHINSHEPIQDYLIPTTVETAGSAPVEVLDVQYPPGEELTFDFSEEPLRVYEGSARIFVLLEANPGAQPSSHTLAGTLRVQACNDQVCLAPSTIAVAFPVLEVAGPGEAVTALNTEIFSSVAGTVGSPPQNQTENSIAAMFDNRGTLAALVGIFVIGLALNLTPCVYPMLSVTVSLFGGQQEASAWRALPKATLYVLGIATMYSVLGVGAALGGGLFGGVLQSPAVLISIGVLLFLLSLSMFGVYELQAPYWLRSRLGNTAATGRVGVYLSGLAVGVFAAPCIGPPIIALLAFVGAQGDPVFGFWAFFILSLGLGAPYLVLGTFSNALNRIPRSGLWMGWVKKVFGFVMAGAAAFYIGLALFPAQAVYAVPATLLAGGLYLGFLDKSGKDQPAFRRVQRAFGAACLLLFAVSWNTLQKPALEWQPFSADALATARAERTPVMLDFYADWCIPCLELDRLTFTDERVIDATADFVKLKVDLTLFDSTGSEALRQEFDVAGVPTIVFLGPDGSERAGSRVVGYLAPDAFLRRVEPVRDMAVVRTQPGD